jgi:hypothetical protein
MIARALQEQEEQEEQVQEEEEEEEESLLWCWMARGGRLWQPRQGLRRRLHG